MTDRVVRRCAFPIRIGKAIRFASIHCHCAGRGAIIKHMHRPTAFAKEKFAQTPEFAQHLDKLAEVAVRIGLGLALGQQMVMTATLDALPLARLITKHAYKAGATLVTTLFSDEESALLRFATLRTRASTPRHRGSMKAWLRHTEMARRAWRSPAMTLPCSPGKIRKK